MSLADTCDQIEVGLARLERYRGHASAYNARYELRNLLNALVRLGQLQIDGGHLGPPPVAPKLDRFNALKARVGTEAPVALEAL